MLVIRKEQMAVFSKLAFSQFEQRMVDHILRFFPRQCEFMGERQVRQAVQFAIQRAQSRGYQSCRGMCLYLSVAFLLGSFFDEDPQYPWAAYAPGIRGMAELDARISGVYDKAMEYFDAVHGEENQHLTRALLRIRVADPAELPQLSADDSATKINSFLAGYFALKAARQPNAADALLAHAAAVAAKYNLTEAGDTAVLLLHSFMLGSGFERDPQFPWIAELLASSSGQRGRLIFERSVEFLNAVIR
jgi:hypothetical protein